MKGTINCFFFFIFLSKVYDENLILIHFGYYSVFDHRYFGVFFGWTNVNFYSKRRLEMIARFTLKGNFTVMCTLRI